MMMLSLFLYWSLVPCATSSSIPTQDPGAPRTAVTQGIADPDSDGDGLSDFQEIHKYFTNPQRKSTAGKDLADGDWEERRQFTYSIRSIIRVMPPYDLQSLNDDYQDVRVRKETKDFVELEVISYPLNTNSEAITANPNWKKDYSGIKEYLEPGITTNWDAAMQKDLLAELATAGIDPEKLTDKEVVERVSRWLFGRSKYKAMFGTMFVAFPGGKPAILPGLETAFEREKGDPNWSVQDAFDHELLGREMFNKRTHGSCTSSAVLLTTVLRTLGIPTRMIITMPMVDANDSAQVALVEKNIRHHGVRTKIMAALDRVGQGFASHTYNEVFVGNRWRRLNYSHLGQNILDEHYFGLMIHVHTFNDLSGARLAPTWGKRYGLGLRDDNFKSSNPYRTLEISDHFGRDSHVPNPPVDRKEHKVITITKAYWLDSKETPDAIRQGARRPSGGEGHLYIHGDEWFSDQDHTQYKRFMNRADKTFVFRANGHPDVRGQLQMSFWTSSWANLRDILIVIPPEEIAKMSQGVPYTIHPVNGTSGYEWKVKDGLTIARQPSLQDRFDALEQRFEKLERRLEQMERERKR
jgi:hypothetical protein